MAGSGEDGVSARAGGDDPGPGEPATTPRAPTRRMQIRRRKLYEEVALRIEELIREDQLDPGDQLPSERELMETFGVGRSAVREALLSLQKMGLVTVSSGARARVARPTARVMVGELAGAARLVLSQPGGVERFQDARALLEIGLARYAAQRATASDIAMLRELLEANRRSIGDLESFRKTDVAFHYGIATIAKNTIFTSMLEAVVEWLTEQRLTSGRATGAGESAVAAHERIFKAIAARDPVAAEQAMQDHLDAVVKLYWQMKREAERGR